MFCTECGKQNPQGAKFCAFCGTKLYVEPTIEPTIAQPVQAEMDKTRPSSAEMPPWEVAPATEETATPEEAGIPEEPAVPEEPVAPEEQPAEPEHVAYPNLPPLRDAPPPFGRTLRPTTVNPAQPNRPVFGQTYAPAEPEWKAPEPEEPAQDEPVPEQTDAGEFFWQPQNGPKRPLDDAWDASSQESADAGWEDSWEDESSQHKGLFARIFARPQPETDDTDELFAETDALSAPEEELPEEEPPRRKARAWASVAAIGAALGKKKGPDMVLTSSGEEVLPERAPNVRKKRDTHVPRRQTFHAEDDSFDANFDEGFEEGFDENLDDGYGEDFGRRKKKKHREDGLDDAYVNKSVRKTLISIAAIALVVLNIWLFATKGGAMFRAGFNIARDAQAYRNLGDKALAGNQIKRAAEAYYQALRYDDDNYDIALLVGKTQQQIGEYEKAAKAYFLCTQLSPTAKEPYECLIALYEMQSQPDGAAYFRNLMEQNTN